MYTNNKAVTEVLLAVVQYRLLGAPSSVISDAVDRVVGEAYEAGIAAERAAAND